MKTFNFFNSHAMVLVEEISLAYARRLFDCGNTTGAFYYCEKADEKGGMLKKELEALDARHNDEVSRMDNDDPKAGKNSTTSETEE